MGIGIYGQSKNISAGMAGYARHSKGVQANFSCPSIKSKPLLRTLKIKDIAFTPNTNDLKLPEVYYISEMNQRNRINKLRMNIRNLIHRKNTSVKLRGKYYQPTKDIDLNKQINPSASTKCNTTTNADHLKKAFQFSIMDRVSRDKVKRKSRHKGKILDALGKFCGRLLNKELHKCLANSAIEKYRSIDRPHRSSKSSSKIDKVVFSKKFLESSFEAHVLVAPQKIK
eukprot:TRINITY_DN8526_c0_g4_i1.p1 TRINITY_DN8526_c0_g4~~TRINITY_DN8526_c0_g4_i1.p1  ORF type:complete len:227 (+),score=15.91 TRINITY_DN8526_c0_g4_i1:70-750(+)